MLELFGLFLLLIAGSLTAVLIAVLVSIIRLLGISPNRKLNRLGSLIRYAITIVVVGAYLFVAFNGLGEQGAVGTYQLVSAPKSVRPDTYDQYQIKLNSDSTYQAINLPSLVDICPRGTFRIEDLPDDYHLINFSCEQSHRQVDFNPDGDRYQIVFNADWYDEDQSKAVVFERID